MPKIKTIILSGGIGYRLKEETEFKPKPMVEIGGKPILWHIMKIYSYYGFSDFVIACGYKGNLIRDYFVNKKYYDGPFTVNTTSGVIKHHKRDEIDRFNITFVDTGLNSLTGERVRRLIKFIDSDIFMVTYGDGVSDINLKHLVDFHKKSKSLATITGVYPMLKYGGFSVDKNGLATKFVKKAQMRQIINGGFMVFSKKTLGLIKPDSMIEDIFFELIKEKKLTIFQHRGFFQSMDTYQDMEDLNKMWNDKPAWKIWD